MDKQQHSMNTAPSPRQGLNRRALNLGLLSGAASLTGLGALTGCASTGGAAGGVSQAELEKAVAAAHRSEANRARDPFRNPVQTLAFFGVAPTQSVIEISPGGGWYTEILAAYLREPGRLYTAHLPKDKGSEGARRARQRFDDKLAALPAVYGRVVSGTMPEATGFTDINPPGGADAVLTFRNVHNWLADNTLDAKLRAFAAVLKQGGTLGVVDHRAAAGTSVDAMKKSGYVTEELMETAARAAGFRLAARSEVNANAKDTKDHPGGVWSLPPVLSGKDVDRAKFVAIGESDRFTHRYVKV